MADYVNLDPESFKDDYDYPHEPDIYCPRTGHDWFTLLEQEPSVFLEKMTQVHNSNPELATKVFVVLLLRICSGT